MHAHEYYRVYILPSLQARGMMHATKDTAINYSYLMLWVTTSRDAEYHAAILSYCHCAQQDYGCSLSMTMARHSMTSRMYC